MQAPIPAILTGPVDTFMIVITATAERIFPRIRMNYDCAETLPSYVPGGESMSECPAGELVLTPKPQNPIIND
mgnify:CR=1 FL=1